MIRRLSFLAIALIAFATSANARQEGKAPEAPKNPGFEVLKSFVGEWYRTLTVEGKPVEDLVSVYKLTGGGSAVHETIFPGKPYEMVTVYHLDGKDVVATHYCAAGNQPRFKLDPSGLPNKLVFKFNGGSNMDPAKDMHMHEGTVTIVDADHYDAVWQGYENGQPVDKHKAVLKVYRKKK